MHELLQRALDSGSAEDLAAVSDVWASGLGVRKMDPVLARKLVERGATLTPHAAAGLGFTDELAKMLAVDPKVIHAKGCDACTPLHFARDIATAELLLAHGARVDARDEDHNSTPAQWLIGEAPEIARFLVEHGAEADLFLAAALGDYALAERLIAADPNCVSHRIGRGPEFPPLGQPRGGTIYQWTLAFNSFAHQIALAKGHPELFDLIHAKSDDVTRFLVACLLGRREEATSLAAEHTGIVEELPASEVALLSYYCWETNLNFDAVRLMLDVGFPVRQIEHQHGHSPLHNAAWCGSAEVVGLLLERGADVSVVDPNYQATALGYALHSCLIAKRHPEGDFASVVKLLLEAGCPGDETQFPTGHAELDEVWRAYLKT